NRVPKTAWDKVTVTCEITSLPSRVNRSSGRTRTSTNKSPTPPPRSPHSPSPTSHRRPPSPIPGGILTVILRFSFFLPRPWQDSHFSSMTEPAPQHLGHMELTLKNPWE